MRSPQLQAFDLDHTLVRCNISFAFGRYLYRRRLLPLAKALRLAGRYLAHKYLGLSILGLHQSACQLLFRGLARARLQNLLQEFLDENLSAQLDQTVYQRLIQAQRRGDRCALLSASPDFLVEAVARMLQVDDCLGTQYACTEQGLLSHVDEVVQGPQKCLALRQLAERYGIDLSSTTAYSDSVADLELLELAGHAVVVRPDRQLKRRATERGWEILEAK